jgi:hypothetical protein
MKIGIEFDASGNYVSDFLEGMELPAGHQLYEGEPPEGSFQYMPKLVNGAIVEGLTQAEIDAIVNTPIPKTELELLREENDALKLRATQNSTDLQGFMDYYFSINPE